MKYFKKITFLLTIFSFLSSFVVVGNQCPQKSKSLTVYSCSGSYQQTWNQNDGHGNQPRERKFFISVPEKGQSFPVLFLFHGKGGNGNDFLQSFLTHFSELAEKFVVVAPSGFEQSWNVVAEKSRAPDINFIKYLINYVSDFSNVDNRNINLYGVSNGSGFVNNLLIQIDDQRIIRAVTEVSQLNIKQYHNHKFWEQGADNKYNEAKVPMQGKKILALSGDQDFIVPPSGGESLIPANYSESSKLIFLSADDSVLAWAKAMGHSGPKAQVLSYDDSISYQSYLKGQVIHYNFGWDGHAIRSDKKVDIISNFLLDIKSNIPSLVNPSDY